MYSLSSEVLLKILFVKFQPKFLKHLHLVCELALVIDSQEAKALARVRRVPENRDFVKITPPHTGVKRPILCNVSD